MADPISVLDNKIYRELFKFAVPDKIYIERPANFHYCWRIRSVGSKFSLVFIAQYEITPAHPQWKAINIDGGRVWYVLDNFEKSSAERTCYVRDIQSIVRDGRPSGMTACPGRKSEWRHPRASAIVRGNDGSDTKDEERATKYFGPSATNGRRYNVHFIPPILRLSSDVV